MPSADLCSASDCLSTLPVASRRPQNRSPGVIPAAFCAQSPDLRFPSLMDTDFAMQGLLVQRSRLLSGSCSSTRTFATRFFRTFPRVRALAFR